MSYHYLILLHLEFSAAFHFSDEAFTNGVIPEKYQFFFSPKHIRMQGKRHSYLFHFERSLITAPYYQIKYLNIVSEGEPFSDGSFTCNH